MFCRLLAGICRRTQPRSFDRYPRNTFLVVAALLLMGEASAYEVFDNGRLRFGTGAEASVNSNGNLQQPFYFDAGDSNWYQLTFSNYPLDNRVGIGGDGTNEWNLNGTIVENNSLTGQVLNTSGFTITSGSQGHGTIVSTGTMTINGKTLELRNTYELPADKSFVKITTRLTNTSGSSIGNVRLWVGTRDDFVGFSDQPTKQRGNLANGAFTKIGNAATRAAALKIFSGQTGVLFYSTSNKAHTSINSCCSFSNATQTNPQTSAIELTNDGSYALFVRMADLANSAYEEFTWYYAAGPLANLDSIVGEVASESGAGAIAVNTSSGSGGSIAPTSANVTAGATTAFTITPSPGYHIDAVTGCGGSLSGTTFTTGAIASTCTVSATFAIDTHLVSTSATAGGSITPSQSTVNHNATTNFTVTPNTGYEIANVQGCGGSLSGNTFTTAAVTTACTVSASFSLKTYALTAIAGTGGSISPANSTAAHNTTANLTVTPNAGFHIVSVQGCGGTLSGNTFTTSAVTAACAVNATFGINTYVVSASAGDGGSVSPAAQLLSHGATASIDIFPASGYSIASVSGCGGVLTGGSFASAPVTGPCAITATFAVTPPTFEPAQPAALDINARELFVALPAGIHPKAHAFDGSELNVELIEPQARYEPGRYVLTWKATDPRGISSTVEQVLRVWPTVSFGPDTTIGMRAGNSAFVRIALNGRSPQYPFVVDYTATGDLQGHDLQSGRVVFQEGEVDKQIGFAVLSTSAAGTADRQVRLALDSSLNRLNDRELIVTLTSLNKAPAVRLSATQGDVERPSVNRNSGPITIAVDIDDPNTNDTHTVQWTGPSGAQFTRSGNGIVVEPGSLPVGVHRFELTVTDNGSPPTITRSTFELVVRETDAPLPSGATMILPNGLPNHPSYAPIAPNVLPERQGELTHHIMEAEAGTQLRLGSYAILQGQYETEVESATTALPSDSVSNVGGYFDFVIADLPRVGESVSVVLPQRSPIPAQPVYRKFDPATSRWMTFVEDLDNRLASAPGAEGFCPPPASTDYRAGLTAGDWCVRLTIKDGGPNDSDKQANGSVADPGGVGSMSTVVVTGQTGGKSGGGGAFDWLLLVAGIILALMRVVGNRAAFAATLGMLSFAAIADTSVDERASHAYGGFALGAAHSDASESELTRALRERGYSATATLSDTTRSAWRVFAGWQWRPMLGLEVGYTDLGVLNSSFSATVADIQEFLRDTNDLHPISGNGFDAVAVLRYPVTTSFALRAKAGAFFWKSNVETDNVASEVSRDRDGIDPVFGIGVDAALSQDLQLRLEGTRYKLEHHTIDFVGLGLSYHWR